MVCLVLVETEDLPLQILDMPAWNMAKELIGLVHHSDHRSNYVYQECISRIIELDGPPPVESKGNS